LYNIIAIFFRFSAFGSTKKKKICEHVKNKSVKFRNLVK